MIGVGVSPVVRDGVLGLETLVKRWSGGGSGVEEDPIGAPASREVVSS